MARARRRHAKAVSAEDWAGLKFAPQQPEAERFIGSLRDWLDRAETDYPIIRLASAVLQHDDAHALEMVRSVGLEAAVEFAEELALFVDVHRAIATWADSACVRLIAGMSRFELVEAEKEPAGQ